MLILFSSQAIISLQTIPIIFSHFFVAFLRKQEKNFRVRIQDGIIVPVFLP